MSNNRSPLQIPVELPALTGLRGIAAWLIALFHLRSAPGFPAPVAEMIGRAPLAVDLFFVLSGFILCHVYARSLERDSFRTGRFLLFRLARIYPLHLATLLFYLFLALIFSATPLSPIDPGKYRLAAVPQQLLLIHAWGLAPQLTFNVPSWSVSAEWFVYLLFPILVRVTRGWPAPVLAAVAMGLFLLAFHLLSEPGRPLTARTFDLGALRALPEFLLGMAAWRWWREGFPVSPRLLLGPLLAGLLAVLAFDLPDPLLVLLFPPLLMALAAAPESALLARSPFLHFGRLSYAIYLVHMPVFTVWLAGLGGVMGLFEGWPHGLPVLVGLLLVWPAAAMAHHLIELPARRWLRSLARGGRSGAAGWQNAGAT